MKEKYDLKFKKASAAYIQKNVKSLKQSNPSKAYATLKRLGAAPGTCSDIGSFTLQDHENLAIEEQVQKIATHFAKISQLYPPLNIERLPDDVKQKIIKESPYSELPIMLEHQVYQTLLTVNCTKSGVPGDLPPRLTKEFTAELAAPATMIYSGIVQCTMHSGIEGVWPEQWKI